MENFLQQLSNYRLLKKNFVPCSKLITRLFSLNDKNWLVQPKNKFSVQFTIHSDLPVQYNLRRNFLMTEHRHISNFVTLDILSEEHLIRTIIIYIIRS